MVVNRVSPVRFSGFILLVGMRSACSSVGQTGADNSRGQRRSEALVSRRKDGM